MTRPTALFVCLFVFVLLLVCVCFIFSRSFCNFFSNFSSFFVPSFFFRVGFFALHEQRQQDMFWFGKPDMMLIMLQSMQFLLAIMVALLIW